MSQLYRNQSNDDARFAAGEGSSMNATGPLPDESASNPGNPPDAAPTYMLMGDQEITPHAAALINSLGHGSSSTSSTSYSGSLSAPSSSSTPAPDSDSLYGALMQDHPTPSRSTDTRNDIVSQNLTYNLIQSRLISAIGKCINVLEDIRGKNNQWPFTYPNDSHISPQQRHIHRSSTTTDMQHEYPSPDQAHMRRARTSLDMNDMVRSPSPNVTSAPAPIGPQLSIFKLDVKLGAFQHHGADFVSSLDKKSLASFFDAKARQSVAHLSSLLERIQDTSSKVLITGDLNAGKSTFCNALLRRKLLPEDQQPCTSVFCEVLDARVNSGVEEVHAVPTGVVYKRFDESTYDVYALKDLEALVVDNTKYFQCKVYIKDTRSINESLLNNGVVDISIIDAPGLNSDSVKTTAVFARQEEIDVVVFVVSAANHFTLSAQEFIANAANEKTYIFIVVNGYDNIRDKKRCQQMVLRQVDGLSPRTRKEAAELVHFVSSNAIPVGDGPSGTDPESSGASGYGANYGNGKHDDGDGGDDYDNDKKEDDKPEPPKGKGKGKGKEKEKEDEKNINDFENLEACLRRFVLEKRSYSKLAPAKTYLLNLLSDINILASVNREQTGYALSETENELQTLIPDYDAVCRNQIDAREKLTNGVDETCEDVYDHTRSSLSATIETLSEATCDLQYPGLFSVFQYAEDLKFAMLDRVTNCVLSSEQYARNATEKGVNMTRSLGLIHVGNTFEIGMLNSAHMFHSRRHQGIREIDAEIDFWDFFDIATLWQGQDKVAGAGAAATTALVLGTKTLGSMGIIDNTLSVVRVLGANNIRRFALPTVIAAVGLSVAYAVSYIPQCLAPNIQRKISATLENMDYVHLNSTRISSEVRRILVMPAEKLQSTLHMKSEELGRRKEKVSKSRTENETMHKYFSDLLKKASAYRQGVESIEIGAITDH